MLTSRQLFLRHLAQTSPAPLLLEIEQADGVWLTDVSGKKYLDLISGIGVSNLGHRHPEVTQAIREQLDRYAHLMVYGEFVQSPQVQLAKLLTSRLPESLSRVYFVNSGSEAVEGALKLAKKYTGRSEIVSCRQAYHGSTHGALSVMGDETLKRPFRPLLPGIRLLDFNDHAQLGNITDQTAAVLIEPIQGEAGVRLPERDYLQQLRQRCAETGALLIFDEIQTGMGRTGSLFAFQEMEVTPDILLSAKALGGGMPLGAFIASEQLMQCLAQEPPLGHITTFGGHPVCCAAGKAALEALLAGDYLEQVEKKALRFREQLRHPLIKAVRGKGLFMVVEMHSETVNMQVIEKCVANGLVTDWFLFAPHCLRIAPPLIITEEEIDTACRILLESLDAIKA